MLEKPDIADEVLRDCLKVKFGLEEPALEFLPLGADLGTAVYKVTTPQAEQFFLKLRQGAFQSASVLVPKLIAEQGVGQVIPPLPTLANSLWTYCEKYTLVLYPFIKGQHGFKKKLTREQWVIFGQALRKFHETKFPLEVTSMVPTESFTNAWSGIVLGYLDQLVDISQQDGVAASFVKFMTTHREQTLRLVERLDSLSVNVRDLSMDFILCHGDIHAWNLLVVDKAIFYIVDWDTLILAPPERDLMFIGCGLGGQAFSPEEESKLFLQGYGSYKSDPSLLAYYRYRRIVEDIALFSEQILDAKTGAHDRRQALAYLKSNYLPHGSIELARKAEQREFG